MSEKLHFILMAEYNQLMNQRIFSAAKKLSETSLQENKGAFFKSVIGTLNHIVVGDIIWLKRFAQHSSFQTVLSPLDQIGKPAHLDTILFSDLAALGRQRTSLDKLILEWSHQLATDELNQNLEYSNMKGEKFNKRVGDLILHLFLHQIHHRGQVSTLLSQEGIDFGETDLIEIIPNTPAK